MNIDSKNETVFIGIDEACQISGLRKKSNARTSKERGLPSSKIWQKKNQDK